MNSAPGEATLSMVTARARTGVRPETLLKWSLRLFGSVDLLAIVAVFMSATWMVAGHRVCGLSEFPAGPVTVYLARSVAMLYAFHGVLLWWMSFDVVRRREMIGVMAWGAVVMGLLLIGIDLRSGMPVWWCLLEGPAFTASGVWLLVVLRSDKTVMASAEREGQQ